MDMNVNAQLLSPLSAWAAALKGLGALSPEYREETLYVIRRGMNTIRHNYAEAVIPSLFKEVEELLAKAEREYSYVS